MTHRSMITTPIPKADPVKVPTRMSRLEPRTTQIDNDAENDERD
jgi:hypothetical protein